jgi:hypothetical protein
VTHPTLHAVHWHAIPGGIEFEAENGSVVHVTLSNDLAASLGARLVERGATGVVGAARGAVQVHIQPQTPGTFAGGLAAGYEQGWYDRGRGGH